MVFKRLIPIRRRVGDGWERGPPGTWPRIPQDPAPAAGRGAVKRLLPPSTIFVSHSRLTLFLQGEEAVRGWRLPEAGVWKPLRSQNSPTYLPQTSRVPVCAGNPLPPGKASRVDVMKGKKKQPKTQQKARQGSRNASPLRTRNPRSAVGLRRPSKALLSPPRGQEIIAVYVP